MILGGLAGCDGESGGAQSSQSDAGALDVDEGPRVEADGSGALLDGGLRDAADWPALERPTSNPPPVREACGDRPEPCLLPWPRSGFEIADPSTPTGLRVALPEDLGMPTIASRLLGRPADGFSPVGTMAAFFPDGVDLAALPSDPDGTTAPDSPILLLDADATSPTWGQAWPWRATAAEAEAGQPPGQLLFLTPLKALPPGGRFAVLVDRKLKSADGGETQPDEATHALLSADLHGDLTELPAAQRYALDLMALAQLKGWRQAQVARMWDFHVRSAAGISGTLSALSRETLAWAATRPVLTATNPRPGPKDATRYDLTIRVPMWRADRFAPINLRPDGTPEPVSELEVTAILVVPANATAERPAIPMLFGHGLSASAELMYAQLVPALDLESGPYALLLPDWDLHGARGAGLQDILAIAGRLDGTAFAHSLLQSAADSLVFSDALSRLGPLPDRGAVFRPGTVHYLGQSLGSIIGLMGNAVDPQVRSAVYNVGGGALSAVLREGGVVEELGLKDAIHEIVIMEPADGLTPVQAVELVMAMSQIALDEGDPASMAAAGLRPMQPFILQESLGDGIVINVATDLLARTLELPLVTPAVMSVADLPTVEAPTMGRPSQGLTQFKVANDGFRAHLALSFRPLQNQVMHFFASFEDESQENDGDIDYACDGHACDLVGE